MDAARGDSRANLALIAELEAMGVFGVTSRKLERWRQAGAIPRVAQDSLGRGGTLTHWPPGTARQVAALVGLLERRVPLQECPLALFHLGFPVEVEVLRAGYLELYGKLATGLTAVAADASDATESLDRSDAVAWAVADRAGRGSMTRQWERRIRQARRAGQVTTDGRTRDVLQDALATALTGLLAGEPPTAEGAAELIQAIGLDDGQDPHDVAATLSRLHIDALTGAIRAATQQEWEQARTDSDALFDMARSRRSAEISVARAASGLIGLDDFLDRYYDPMFASQVALTPVLLVLPTPQWREALRSQQAVLRAMSQMLSDFPPHTHPFFGPDGARALDEATQAEREEILALVAGWAQANPDLAATIQQLTEGS